MSSLGNKQIMSKNIQYYMTLHNKTRNDMCEVLGVKYSTFSDWVNGNVYPKYVSSMRAIKDYEE